LKNQGAFFASYLMKASPPKDKRKHVVTSNIEHPAILECLEIMQRREGIDLSIVAVNDEGIVSADDIANAIIPLRTALVTVMVANNEVGSLQPIKQIAQSVAIQESCSTLMQPRRLGRYPLPFAIWDILI